MKHHDLSTKDSIVVIDNRPMFRAGVINTIQSTTDQCYFTSYGSFDELTDNSQKNGNLTFLIRVGNTLETTMVTNVRKLRSTYKSCKIILYDYQDSINDIILFFKEKIDAYLPDNFDEKDLQECITSVKSGRIYINTEIALELLTTKHKTRTKKTFRLTPTEIRVANLLVTGMRSSHIAREMDRKISTISTIKSNIYRKTKVSNIIDLIVTMAKVPREFRI